MPAHALSGVCVRTMLAIEAGHALPAIGTRSAVGRQPIAARIIDLVTCLTCTVDALTGPCLITIIIPNTADAGRSIGPVLANGGCATASTVVYGVTGLAEIANTLLTIAVPIGDAGHTIATIS